MQSVKRESKEMSSPEAAAKARSSNVGEGAGCWEITEYARRYLRRLESKKKKEEQRHTPVTLVLYRLRF
jgi:hypothetical protein